VNKKLWAALVVAFLVVGGGIYLVAARERKAAVAQAIADASHCVAGGRYGDVAALSVALRHRQRADADVDVAARAWPAMCGDALTKLGNTVAEWRDDAEGHELARAVTALHDAATTAYDAEHVGTTLRGLSTGLLALWAAAAAAAIDVDTVVPAGDAHPPAELTIDALSALPATADRPITFETLGATQDDSRHARYVMKDGGGAVYGFCSFGQKSLCAPIPKALRKPKTQLLGYTEPGVLPLLYAQDEGRIWSVYRADNGARLFTGFAGGAWSSEGYAATVTDDEGREDRIVVVEQRGKAPIARRVIDLKDIDAEASRVSQAIAIWQNVLVRTKRSDGANAYFAVPLPLAEKIVATQVGAGSAVDFCRGTNAVYVTDGASHHAFRDGKWGPAQRSECPSTAEDKPPLIESGGALWRREGGALFLDPFFVAGAFVDQSALASWEYLPPRTLAFEMSGRTRLVHAPTGESSRGR
jgi:hypothetical protein